MERHSLPLAYYLNNGEPDKTGFQQVALSAFYKAIHFHPSKSCVTIGPSPEIDAKTEIKENFDLNNKNTQTCVETPVQENDILTSGVSEKNCSTSEFLSDSKDKFSDIDNELLIIEKISNESLEVKEEKLLRQRILTSLENICLLEAQAKLNNMKSEWTKRDEETMTRLQEELDATTSFLEQKLALDFNERRVILEELAERNPEPDKDAQPLMGQGINHDLGNDNLKASAIPVTKNSHVPQDPLLSNDIAKFPVTSSPKSVSQKPLSDFDLSKPKDTTFTFSFQATPQDKNISTATTKVHSNINFGLQSSQTIIDSNLGNEKTKLENAASATQLPPESKLEKQTLKETPKPSEKEAVKEDRKVKPEDESTSMEEDVVLEGQKVPEKTKEIDPEISRIQTVMQHYKKYKKIHTEAASSLKSFLNDDSLKKFRSDCQKAVNVPVNAISGVSAAHLTDKLNKLSALLAGNSVLVSNKSFSPSQHPLGVLYCHFLLAEKIVRQGEDAVSVKADSAFPIALIALEMWRQFPKFGDLLIGAFHKVCPYLIPIYWIKEEGMSNEDYERLLGFKYSGGERENIDMFLKRQGGVVRLYFSLVVSHMKGGSSPHPLPLQEAWRWLAMFTGLEPSAEITATLLYDMLEVTGHSMLKTYGKQFLKLIHLICVHFIPKIEKVTPKGKGGPVSRLKSFLEQLIRTQDIKPPKGILPINFW